MVSRVVAETLVGESEILVSKSEAFGKGRAIAINKRS